MEASGQSVFNETPITEIDAIFRKQQDNLPQLAKSSASERIRKLKAFRKTVLDNRDNIRQALKADCSRHEAEVDMTEIYPVISEINHTVRNLRRWMKARSVNTPLALMGSSSSIKAEPKGNTLIISPWNFPVNLTLAPLVSAVAAGNAVILKTSEFTPHSTEVIRKIISGVFDEREVALIEGGIETGKYLLKLEFNHIFFTGSPQVGKIVMKAASANLASVTLELGGKSPTIVDASADISKAAKRIAWGKYVNNGQICIAPDYVLVHASKYETFIKLLQDNIDSFYGAYIASSSSYSRIINGKHFERIKHLYADAVAQGASAIKEPVFDKATRLISPTVLKNVDLSSEIMEEEIFGPLLPVIKFNDLTEALEIINKREKPLALYIFARKRNNISRILNSTSSGAVCINHNAVHFYNTSLPFGGVNNSGLGRSHGEAGFMAFSNMKSIYRQKMPSALELLVPPYNKFKQKLIDLTLKYF